MRLSDLAPGTPFVVSRVLVGGEIGKRLADMGFTDGAAGILVRGAFMRGPIQVQIRGYDLLIRRGEAKLIEVAMAGGVGAAGSVGAAEDSGASAGAAGAGHENDAAGGPYRARRGRGGLFRSLFAEPDCCGDASLGSRVRQSSRARQDSGASKRGDIGHDPTDRKSA
jgi:ferrous iron transport protein A